MDVNFGIQFGLCATTDWSRDRCVKHNRVFQTASPGSPHPHRWVGAKYFDCVVCRFHVNYVKLFSGAVDTLSEFNISYWFDNLGFILREICCCTTLYISHGVSQQHTHRVHQALFWCRCRGDKHSLRGEFSHFQSFYFVIVLLSLFLLLFCLLNIKITKTK